MDKRLKKLPEMVRERPFKRSEVALLMLGRILSWEKYEIDKPF